MYVNKRLLKAASALTLIVLSTSAQSGVISSYNFEDNNTSGWSNSTITTAPNGEKFLGEFNNQTISYSISGIDTYNSLTVNFDLLILKTWDGDGTQWGADSFVFNMNDEELINNTFSNVGESDSFPGDPDLVNSLGYPDTNYIYEDSIYHFSFTTTDYDSNLELLFSANGLQDIGDESWGLDNVQVSTITDNQKRIAQVPLPSTLALFGLGLLALNRRISKNK